MELLKIVHPVVGWQLINPADFDPEVHQAYEESEESEEPTEASNSAEPGKSEELPPEKTIEKPAPQRRHRKEA